jgi:EpsI family protein
MKKNLAALTGGVPLYKFWLVAALLGCQIVLMSAFKLEEKIPTPPALANFPLRLGDWTMLGEEPLDAATEALLRPDLSLMRSYRNSQGGVVSVFVGYFKTTQANHPAPHSPTVCLPGAGWRDVGFREISLPMAGGGEFPLNEYLLEKAAQKLSVLYWYQNSERAWANPVFSKIYIFPDFMRFRRTDVALVRVTAAASADRTASLENARRFASEVYPAVHLAYQGGAKP